MRYCHGYLSGARCICFAYGPDDATATPSSPASLKSRCMFEECFIGLFFQIDSLCETITEVTNTLSLGGDCTVTQEAQKFVGYPAVYRICFGLALFFAFFAVIMICVKSSSDPRSAIQNGLV